MSEPDSQNVLCKQVACFVCTQEGKEGKWRGITKLFLSPRKHANMQKQWQT
jgi:hypothetical protein